ncbi:MAG: hypothetical protein H7321_09620 [Bacteroidia bacterium]|nr:hypothetical protein [Bacteroidia bacterium]
MNIVKLRYGFLWAAFSLLLISCNNAEKATSTTDSTNTQSTVATPDASDIITAPEGIVVVRYKVSDFAKWRASYDTRDSMRTANGLRNYVIGRGVEDSSVIMVALKTDDMAKAKAFTEEASLQTALQKGYVVGAPKYTFSTVVYQDMSPNMSDLRCMSFFSVKDWDAWKKAFETGKQLRTENGLTDRAYGYEVDDNHKVVMVAGINNYDTAKVFWNSDIMKQRRAEAGVVGEVERFVYRVIQKY